MNKVGSRSPLRDAWIMARRIKRFFLGPKDFVPYEALVELDNVTGKFQIDRPGDVIRICQFGNEKENATDIIASLQSKDVFWDVGAYVGLLTVLAARKVTNGKVVSVEPDPGCFERLKKHVGMNDISNVELINSGLGDSPGKLVLNTSGGYGDAPSFFQKQLKDEVAVPVKTLDGICAERPELAPTVLKIDVEGFEERVLRGGVQALASEKLRMIFLEVHPVVMAREGESMANLFSLLEQNGFKAKSCALRKNEMHYKFQRSVG